MNKRLSVAVTFILFLSLVLVSIPVKAQTASSIVINPDGSITGAYSIAQVGSIYTLTGNITGNIHVEKSDIIINGSGYWLNGNGGTGFDLNDLNTYPTISVTNVTVENLYITNCAFGVSSDGGGNYTLYNDDFSNCGSGAGIRLMDCSHNIISYCTFDNESQITMDYSAAYNTVTECNLPSQNAILIWLSGYETVDRNYWADYLTLYPNATEIDNSGAGNIPYIFDTPNSGTQVFEDNQPLMKPVAIPLMGSNLQTNVPEFPTWIILPLFTVMILLSIVFVRKRTPKKLVHVFLKGG